MITITNFMDDKNSSLFNYRADNEWKGLLINNKKRKDKCLERHMNAIMMWAKTKKLMRAGMKFWGRGLAQQQGGTGIQQLAQRRAKASLKCIAEKTWGWYGLVSSRLKQKHPEGFQDYCHSDGQPSNRAWRDRSLLSSFHWLDLCVLIGTGKVGTQPGLRFFIGWKIISEMFIVKSKQTQREESSALCWEADRSFHPMWRRVLCLAHSEFISFTLPPRGILLEC